MAAQRRRARLVSAIAFGVLAVPAYAEGGPGPLKLADTSLEPIAFTDLAGWTPDDHAAAFTAFRASCAPMLYRGRNGSEDRPVAVALAQVCRRAAALKNPDAAQA